MTVAADLASAEASEPTEATESAAPATGPVVGPDAIRFTFPDADRALSAVRLVQDVRIPADQLDFAWSAGAWTLAIDRPPVDRMEYKLELVQSDGGNQSITDPGNPSTAPGAFGDKSVLELPGYEAPRWLGSAAPPGRNRALDIPTEVSRAACRGASGRRRASRRTSPSPCSSCTTGPSTTTSPN